MSNKQCWSANNEDFIYEELRDLLAEHDELQPGATVYVGEAEPPAYSHFCDADDVIQMMGDRASEIGGEYAEDFPDVSKEAEQELNGLLLAWMQKHCTINFWTVKNIQPYVLTEADCAGTIEEAHQ